MRLFSNSCFGGWMYQMCGIPYSTPFIWAKVTIPDMLYLMKNMETINFKRFTVEPNNDWSLWKIVIDGAITLYWTHYKFSPIDQTPRTYEPADVYYSKIWEYIYQKYQTRLARMNQNTDRPSFILDFTKTVYEPSESLLNAIPEQYKCVVIHPYDKVSASEPHTNVLYLKTEWNVSKKWFLTSHIDEIRNHILQ